MAALTAWRGHVWARNRGHAHQQPGGPEIGVNNFSIEFFIQSSGVSVGAGYSGHAQLPAVAWRGSSRCKLHAQNRQQARRRPWFRGQEFWDTTVPPTRKIVGFAWPPCCRRFVLWLCLPSYTEHDQKKGQAGLPLRGSAQGKFPYFAGAATPFGRFGISGRTG